MGERAAEQRSDAEAEHQKAGPRGDGGWPSRRRRAGPDRSQGARHGEGGRETLQGPSRQQLVLISAIAMTPEATASSTMPKIDAGTAPNRSAAWPPGTMQTAETTRYALTAHCTPSALSERSVRMVGKAAVMAVLLAPAASIARYDDHSTAAG